MPDHQDFNRQTFNVSGTGHSFGDIQQHIYASETDQGPTAVCERKLIAVTPLTNERLALLSVIIGVLSLIPAYATFKPLVDFLRSSDIDTLRFNPIALIIFAVAVLAAMIAVEMRRIVKLGLQQFSRFWWLPVATTVRGRFALARYSGSCPICGNKMHFLNRATGKKETLNVLGGPGLQVTTREMTTRCVANHEHRWPVDPALVWSDTRA